MMAIKVFERHLLMMLLTFLAQSSAQRGCTYLASTYSHLDKFDHENGCTQLQCQFEEIVPISEACGKEIDNSCHEVNFVFVRDGQQYLCTKSEESGSTVYRYVTQAIPTSAKGCYVGVQSYKHLDLAVSKDSCRVRQCQNGQSPFVVSACKGHDKECHPVESIYTYQGIMYRCKYTNNVFKFISVQKPTTVPTTEPTTVPTTESTTLPTTVSTTVATTVPTTQPTTVSTTVPTTQPTTVSTTVPTTQPTTVSTTVPTTQPTTVATTVPTTQPTTVSTTVPTTQPTTVATTVPTTKSTTLPTTVPTTVATTVPTTQPTTVATTVPTTQSTTVSTTVPTTEPTIVLSAATTCVAIANINVIFAIDSSGSIGLGNFLKNFIFVRRIVRLVQGSIGLKFALLTFADKTILVSGLTDDKERFSQALDKAIYQRSTTHTNLAIDYARGLALTDGTEARTVIIVVTDGKSTNSTLTRDTAARAKEEGDSLISIGVGEKFDESELQCIASGPGGVFRVHSYTDLDVLSWSIAEGLCNVPPRLAGGK